MVEVPASGGFAVYRFYPEDRRDAEVVYGFVLEPAEAHGGAARVETTVAGGARFELELPRHG